MSDLESMSLKEALAERERVLALLKTKNIRAAKREWLCNWRDDLTQWINERRKQILTNV